MFIYDILNVLEWAKTKIESFLNWRVPNHHRFQFRSYQLESQDSQRFRNPQKVYFSQYQSCRIESQCQSKVYRLHLPHRCKYFHQKLHKFHPNSPSHLPLESNLLCTCIYKVILYLSLFNSYIFYSFLTWQISPTSSAPSQQTHSA